MECPHCMNSDKLALTGIRSFTEQAPWRRSGVQGRNTKWCTRGRLQKTVTARSFRTPLRPCLSQLPPSELSDKEIESLTGQKKNLRPGHLLWLLLPRSLHIKFHMSITHVPIQNDCRREGYCYSWTWSSAAFAQRLLWELLGFLNLFNISEAEQPVLGWYGVQRGSTEQPSSNSLGLVQLSS